MRRNHRFQVADISARPDIAGGDPTAAVPDELLIGRALGRLSPDDRIVPALRFYRDMNPGSPGIAAARPSRDGPQAADAGTT
jgi:hypothetical protein